MAKDKTKSSTHTSSPLARMDASFKAKGRVGFYGQCKLLENIFFRVGSHCKGYCLSHKRHIG